MICLPKVINLLREALEINQRKNSHFLIYKIDYCNEYKKMRTNIKNEKLEK